MRKHYYVKIANRLCYGHSIGIYVFGQLTTIQANRFKYSYIVCIMIQIIKQHTQIIFHNFLKVNFDFEDKSQSDIIITRINYKLISVQF